MKGEGKQEREREGEKEKETRRQGKEERNQEGGPGSTGGGDLAAQACPSEVLSQATGLSFSSLSVLPKAGNLPAWGRQGWLSSEICGAG